MDGAEAGVSVARLPGFCRMAHLAIHFQLFISRRNQRIEPVASISTLTGTLHASRDRSDEGPRRHCLAGSPGT